MAARTSRTRLLNFSAFVLRSPVGTARRVTSRFLTSLRMPRKKTSVSFMSTKDELLKILYEMEMLGNKFHLEWNAFQYHQGQFIKALTQLKEERK